MKTEINVPKGSKRKGLKITVDGKKATEETIEEVKGLLRNELYARLEKEASQIFKDTFESKSERYLVPVDRRGRIIPSHAKNIQVFGSKIMVDVYVSVAYMEGVQA